jgi:hypothetical protein
MAKFTADQIKINADFADSLLKFKTETSEIPELKQILLDLK